MEAENGSVSVVESVRVFKRKIPIVNLMATNDQVSTTSICFSKSAALPYEKNRLGLTCAVFLDERKQPFFLLLQAFAVLVHVVHTCNSLHRRERGKIFHIQPTNPAARGLSIGMT